MNRQERSNFVFIIAIIAIALVLIWAALYQITILTLQVGGIISLILAIGCIIVAISDEENRTLAILGIIVFVLITIFTFNQAYSMTISVDGKNSQMILGNATNFVTAMVKLGGYIK